MNSAAETAVELRDTLQFPISITISSLLDHIALQRQNARKIPADSPDYFIGFMAVQTIRFRWGLKDLFDKGPQHYLKTNKLFGVNYPALVNFRCRDQPALTKTSPSITDSSSPRI